MMHSEESGRVELWPLDDEGWPLGGPNVIIGPVEIEYETFEDWQRGPYRPPQSDDPT